MKNNAFLRFGLSASVCLAMLGCDPKPPKVSCDDVCREKQKADSLAALEKKKPLLPFGRTRAEAAEKGLDNLKRLMTVSTFHQFGFSSLEEVTQAKLTDAVELVRMGCALDSVGSSKADALQKGILSKQTLHLVAQGDRPRCAVLVDTLVDLKSPLEEINKATAVHLQAGHRFVSTAFGYAGYFSPRDSAYTLMKRLVKENQKLMLVEVVGTGLAFWSNALDEAGLALKTEGPTNPCFNRGMKPMTWADVLAGLRKCGDLKSVCSAETKKIPEGIGQRSVE